MMTIFDVLNIYFFKLKTKSGMQILKSNLNLRVINRSVGP